MAPNSQRSAVSPYPESEICILRQPITFLLPFFITVALPSLYSHLPRQAPVCLFSPTSSARSVHLIPLHLPLSPTQYLTTNIDIEYHKHIKVLLETELRHSRADTGLEPVPVKCNSHHLAQFYYDLPFKWPLLVLLIKF